MQRSLIPNLFSRHRRGPRPFFHLQRFLMTSFFTLSNFSFQSHHCIPRTNPSLTKKRDNCYKLDTHTHWHSTLYIDILYNCTQLVQNCTSPYTTHINGTHTQTLHFIYIDSCTVILHNLYRWTALLYITYTHLWWTHFAWISCTPVSVQLYCRTWRILTNESPRWITFMNLVDQSQSQSPPPHPTTLTATCWPRHFWLTEWAVIKNRVTDILVGVKNWIFKTHCILYYLLTNIWTTFLAHSDGFHLFPQDW